MVLIILNHKRVYINLYTCDKYVDIFFAHFLLPGSIKQRLIFAWLVLLIFSQRPTMWSGERLAQAWKSFIFGRDRISLNIQHFFSICGGEASWFFIYNAISFNVFSGNYCNTSCGNANTDRNSPVLHKSIVHEYKYHDSFSLVLNIQMMLGKAYCCSVDSEAVCFSSCSL